MRFKVEIEQLLDLVSPPILILKTQVVRCTTKKEEMLGFKFQASVFWIEDSVGMHKTTLREDLAHVWSNLERFAEVPDDLGVASIRDLDRVGSPVGCLQLDHTFAIKDLWIRDAADITSDEI